ncbi:reverse transcriptase domain-containing protein [Serratia aquatilis]|uniref:Reverse transcriptase domain-containing protein n=1 Tax=Serratia aquatilis TaxID=1737515 RepID=A0ABV6E8N5_9GAMM
MSHEKLRNVIDEQVGIISRKVTVGNYKFTKYKLKLIGKGRGKAPREISIPTIRDKIALKALCKFLQARFAGSVSFELPQIIIRKIKYELENDKYDTFIKLDVSNFYPSIKHEELIKRVKKRVRDERIVSLINSAIKTPTVARSTSFDEIPSVGVPQGLSISNILAAIYLSNIDKALNSLSDIKYFRYVDDILILCDAKRCAGLTADIIKRFKRIGLVIHKPNESSGKSSIGSVNVNRFSYLGYDFVSGLVYARQSSMAKLRESLLTIFTEFKYSKIKSIEFLEWRLNLRITGCVFQGKSKGWAFFFSEITDESFLHEMDLFLKKLCIRFNVDLNLKNFVRTIYSIRHKRLTTRYIPNFDDFTIEEMIHVLEFYFKKSTTDMAPTEIIYNFKKRISKQVKDLETDIIDAGSTRS